MDSYILYIQDSASNSLPICGRIRLSSILHDAKLNASILAMLLKVDAYPHDYVPLPGNKLKSPIAPLFAAPNTTKDGVLIKVGRKDGDVVFSDKSVSREHLELTLDAAGNIMLKDQSKFGNFIVIEESQQNAAKTGDDSETGNDETDNEGEPSQTVFKTLSEITKRIVTDCSKATLKKVEPDAPVLLNPLLHENNGRVIVQCGQNGSTMVITRVPLKFIFSRLDKATKDDLANRIHEIGAKSAEVFDKLTTHLVAKDRISNAKNLVAWLTETPMVTSEFVQAMLSRKHPSDPMPNESDYIPSGDKFEFWNIKPNPRLWSHLTLLSLVDDDMESLVRAAGANIIPLYKVTGKAAIQLIRDSACEGAFFVNSSASKHGKLIAELKKMTVPYVIQKCIASCASEQLPLSDTEGNVIGVPIDKEVTPTMFNKSQDMNGDDHRMITIEPGQPKQRNAFPKNRVDQRDQSVELMEETVPESRSQKRRHETVTTQEVPNYPQTKQHSVTSETHEVTHAPSPQQYSAHTTSKRIRVDQEKKIRSKRDVSHREDEPIIVPLLSSQIRQLGHQKPEEGFLVQKGVSSSQRSKKRSHPETDEEPIEGDAALRRMQRLRWLEIHNEEIAESGRKRLKGKDEQGWFTAAPQGNERKAYKNSNEDLEATLGEGQKIVTCAPTCPVKGLIVDKCIIPAYNTKFKENGKNFSRFQKNSVIRGKHLTRIQLRSVLPKETELQRRMEDEDRVLQEEQRKADALFSEIGDRSGKIKGYFKPKSQRSRMS